MERSDTSACSTPDSTLEDDSLSLSWLEDGDCFLAWRDKIINRDISGINHFDRITDDMLAGILSKLISTVKRPADFMSAIKTCKRFRDIGMLPSVLGNASESALAVRAQGWNEASPSRAFLRKCADSGSMDASYTLGMMELYCLKKWEEGACLIEKAANGGHPRALYSLAVIRFKGSGGSDEERDMEGGVALCKKAALVGHIGAMRELSECYRRGYGVDSSEKEAIRFQQEADSMEMKYLADQECKMPCREREFELEAAVPWGAMKEEFKRALKTKDFECSEHPLRSHEKHVAMDFVKEWNKYYWTGGFRSCSLHCQRRETREDEFRRCPHCGIVTYCSFNCELHDLIYVRNGDCFHSCGNKFSID